MRQKRHKVGMRFPWDVAKEDLCVRCGFCFDICPSNLIVSSEKSFPTITDQMLELCTDCGICMKGCPADVDYPGLSQSLFGKVCKPLDAVGVAKKVCVGYALDPEIRSKGSSGGVVTQLLVYMLEKGIIDQALVCGMHEDRPWEPNPILAWTEKEIVDSAQSKYTIVPQMRKIKQIMNSGKRTAIVGVPCQINAYRKFTSWHDNISQSVPIVISLACNSTLEIEASLKLLEIARIRFGEIRKLEYRYGKSWPGGIHVTLRNGKIKSLHGMDIKAAFNRLTLFYTPSRCLTCIDFAGELSDLSVMDPWIKDVKGHYLYPEGYSLIIVRNHDTQKILDRAVSDGYFFLEEISKSMLKSMFRQMVKKKKIGASIRIEKLKRKGKAYPHYNIEFPRPSLGDRVNEKLDSLKRLPGKWTWAREIGMRVAFSRFGDLIMKVKRIFKN